MNRSFLLVALLIVAGCTGVAVRGRNSDRPAERPLILNEADVRWVDVAATPGEKVSVIAGDPNAPGEYTLRREFPTGHQTLPHWHPHAEYGTVLSGVFHPGIGEQADRGEAVAVRAGGFIRLPPYTPHYSYADEAVVLQVHGPGPRQTYFVHEHPLPRLYCCRNSVLLVNPEVTAHRA